MGKLERLMTAERMINEEAYKTLKKRQPNIIGIIRALLDKGETPHRIALFVQSEGGSPFLAGLVEMAADYMKS